MFLIVIFLGKEGNYAVLIISVYYWWSYFVNVSSGPRILIVLIRLLLYKITFHPCSCCPESLPSNMLAMRHYSKCVVLYYIIIWCDFSVLLKYWHYASHSALIVYDICLLISGSVSCKYRTWICIKSSMIFPAFTICNLVITSSQFHAFVLMLRFLGSCNFIMYEAHIKKLCNLPLGLKTVRSTSSVTRFLV